MSQAIPSVLARNLALTVQPALCIQRFYSLAIPRQFVKIIGFI